MLLSAADVVHVVSHFADVVYGLIVWSVTAVGESYLEILSVEAAGCSLIRELVPVGSDEIRMLKG